MSTRDTVCLEFDSRRNSMAEGKKLRDGLSVVAQVGRTLWVANDESLSLERLTIAEGGGSFAACAGEHRQFPLGDYLDLPCPPGPDAEKLEEADLEGLAYDGACLWLVGSHSLKRRKPRSQDSPDDAGRRLAGVVRDPNRYLLARIPVIEEDGSCVLARSDPDRGLFAAQLSGDGRGNRLTDALRQDEHLGPYLDIPGKENGFDIEGLAVTTNGRLFLGLRGPVLRGWAVILELEAQDEPGQLSRLGLGRIGANGRPYRKHFIDLGGLGIRELCVQGDDLLILAGPTMDLDGPVVLLRWPDGARPDAEELVWSSRLEKMLDVPYGKGVDHAEGMTLFSRGEGEGDSLLVVYDSACASRHLGKDAVIADLFPLPPTKPKQAARAAGPPGRNTEMHP